MRFRTSFFRYFLGMMMVLAPLQGVNAQDAREDTAAGGTESVTQETPNLPRNEAAPTAAQWQQATADKALGYRDEKEFVPKETPQNSDTPWLLKLIGAIIVFLASPFGKFLLLLLLLTLVGYVLYHVLAGGGRMFARRNKRVAPTEDAATVSEEDLLEHNWEHQLQQALAAGDRRMAIRYSYMLLLQLLHSRDLIAYRHDKTNAAYLQELSGHAIRNDFRQITRQYEYAWYGNFLPPAPAFESYMATFNGVKKQLGAS